MSIQPIDLQTLFVRLSQVGREQSAIKQSVAQNQLVTGNEIAERSQEVGHTVEETKEVSEGPETVHEDGSPNEQPHGEQDRESDSKPEEHADEVFRDPDLGQNIDLTG